MKSHRSTGRVLHMLQPLRVRRWILPPQDTPPLLPRGRTIGLPGGARLFIRESDGRTEGVPVVLLHPWSWTADVAFGRVFAWLAERRRLVTVDLRGHGRSSALDSPVRLEDFIADVRALLDALGIDRAILIGHSLGGVVAMAAARAAPERVAGLVVVASAACYHVSLRDRLFWRLLEAAGPLIARRLGRRMPLRYFLPSATAHPALWRRWRWMEAELARNDVRAMWQVGRMVSRLDLRPALDAREPSTRSVYVVLARDRVCAPTLQRDTAARLGASVLELDADHDVSVVDPETYAGALLAALRCLDAPD